MRKLFFFSLLFALVSCGTKAQDTTTITREQMGGVYYAYHYEEAESAADIPPGFQPFYIAHYGRHGSRWLPDDRRYINVNRQFEDTGNLTPLGLDVRDRLRKIWDNARGNGGKLTPLGARQQREIARRMTERYPETFVEGAVIDARASVVNRCQASMFAFCDELRERAGYLRMTLNVDKEDMKWIAYASPEQLKLEKDVHTERKFSAQRLMKALFKNPRSIENPENLMSELHTIASSMQDVGLDVTLYDLFTDEEFREIYDHNNTQMTLHNGMGTAYEDICARSAISLWEDIRRKTDATIAGGKPGATLRFGHDTSLYRLLTLMGMDNGDWRYGDTDRMDRVVPMAANLQIVCYRSPEGKPYVLFLHNERPAHLVGDFAERQGDLYAWDEVKRHVDRRIEEKLADSHNF